MLVARSLVCGTSSTLPALAAVTDTSPETFTQCSAEKAAGLLLPEGQMDKQNAEKMKDRLVLLC